jgi:hypothetical protein
VIRAGLICSVLLLAIVLIPAARGDELPQFPDQQQALLRETEDQVVHVQLQLFAARQQHDEAAVSTLTKQFKALQDKRRALIAATKDQLPSQ